jgi:hypothetical protein
MLQLRSRVQNGHARGLTSGPLLRIAICAWPCCLTMSPKWRMWVAAAQCRRKAQRRSPLTAHHTPSLAEHH